MTRCLLSVWLVVMFLGGFVYLASTAHLQDHLRPVKQPEMVFTYDKGDVALTAYFQVRMDDNWYTIARNDMPVDPSLHSGFPYVRYRLPISGLHKRYAVRACWITHVCSDWMEYHVVPKTPQP